MNQHDLKNFLTVAELLHFGRASERCNLSASALTRSIQRLETEVGQQLFLRNNREVQLTRAGIVFREYASRAVREWQSLCEELADDGMVHGAISIYASVTAVYSILPDLLMKYRQRYSEVEIELQTGVAEVAIEKVVAGEIDLAVAALPDRQLRRVEFQPLLTTDLVFIVPKNSMMAELDKIDAETLADLPLVLPSQGLARARVDEWMKKQGLHRNTINEVTGNEGILALVRLGCGVGVVPELVLERSPLRHDVRVIPNAAQLAPYVVGLCSVKKNLERPSVAALWQLAKEWSG